MTFIYSKKGIFIMKPCPFCGELIGDDVNDKCPLCFKSFSNMSKMQSSEKDVTLMTTTDFLDGYRIEKYIDCIFATDIYTAGGLIGGGIINQDNLYGDAFAAIKQKMLRKAYILRANAIVGVRFNTFSVASQIIVIGTGTAVTVSKIE